MDSLEQERSFFGELDGPLTPANYSSRALEASAVVKTGDGILYGFTVTNTKAAAQWVMVFDRRDVPSTGAVPLLAKSVPASDAVGFDWLPGRTFFAGLVLVNSTTQASLTIGAADCIFDAQYI